MPTKRKTATPKKRTTRKATKPATQQYMVVDLHGNETLHGGHTTCGKPAKTKGRTVMDRGNIAVFHNRAAMDDWFADYLSDTGDDCNLSDDFAIYEVGSWRALTIKRGAFIIAAAC